MAAEPEAVLEIDGLDVRYRAADDEVLAVTGLSLRLGRGECVGLVGESGCGKSTVAMAILRHLGRNGRLAAGRIRFLGDDMVALSAEALRAVRGRRIAMICQDAQSALNPSLRISRQLGEVLADRPPSRAAEAGARIEAMLRSVGIVDPASVLRRFPHQLSGGQQQRVLIAMAFLAAPDLLILDEPTTALDVTVEAQVVALLAEMRARHGTTMLFISHNLGLVRRLCDRLCVMYGGEIVESGPTAAVLDAPRHPYTQGLIACIPRLDGSHRDYQLESIPGQVPRLHAKPDRCLFIDRCRHARAGICDRPIALGAATAGRLVRCARWAEIATTTAPAAPPPAAPPAAGGAPVLVLERLSQHFEVRRLFGLGGATVRIQANDAVSFALHPGETLGIVGESGSGKSTLARLIMGLEVPSGGRVTLLGDDVTGQLVSRRRAETVRRVQMVFQNPDDTLNPAHSVGFILGRAVARLGGLGGRRRAAEVDRLLALVRLPPELRRMTAVQLSGGQKQRVAVARAFAGRPCLVVADEPTSALDTSVKTAILDLLLAAQRDSGTAFIFISHDLGVVRYMAGRVGVMYAGAIVETGPAADVFARPCHPYFIALLGAARGLPPDPPALAAADSAEATGPGPQPSQGCPYASRCSEAIAGLCDRVTPPCQEPAPGRLVQCHLPPELLRARATGRSAQPVPATAEVTR